MYLSHSFTSNKALWILRPEAQTHFQLHSTVSMATTLYQIPYSKYKRVPNNLLFSTHTADRDIFSPICLSLQWANLKLGNLEVENSISLKVTVKQLYHC